MSSPFGPARYCSIRYPWSVSAKGQTKPCRGTEQERSAHAYVYPGPFGASRFSSWNPSAVRASSAHCSNGKFVATVRFWRSYARLTTSNRSSAGAFVNGTWPSSPRISGPCGPSCVTSRSSLRSSRASNRRRRATRNSASRPSHDPITSRSVRADRRYPGEDE